MAGHAAQHPHIESFASSQCARCIMQFLLLIQPHVIASLIQSFQDKCRPELCVCLVIGVYLLTS